MTAITPDELRALAVTHFPIGGPRDREVIAALRAAAAALDQAASDRAALDRVREALTWHPACDVHPDDDVITCGWKKTVASITWALRDESSKAT